MFAVLNARQMQEIMVFANIEPISWDTGVSAPPKKEIDVVSKLDAILGPPDEIISGK